MHCHKLRNASGILVASPVFKWECIDRELEGIFVLICWFQLNCSNFDRLFVQATSLVFVIVETQIDVNFKWFVLTLLIINFVITLLKNPVDYLSSIHIHSCLDDVMTKFMINNRRNPWKTAFDLRADLIFTWERHSIDRYNVLYCVCTVDINVSVKQWRQLRWGLNNFIFYASILWLAGSVKCYYRSNKLKWWELACYVFE